jgi:hypothetical protein
MAELSHVERARLEQAVQRLLNRRYQTNPGFTTELVEAWLERANSARRARWVDWPNAAQLAVDLSLVDFTDGYVPYQQVTQQVQRMAGLMRKLADLWDDPKLHAAVGRGMIAADGRGMIAANGDSYCLDTYDDLIADTTDPDVLKRLMELRVAEESADVRTRRALFETPERLSRVLRQTADAAESQLVERPGSPSHARSLSESYDLVAEILCSHTGARPSFRAASPDARFVRAVIKHAGLPWRDWVWRRCGRPQATGSGRNFRKKKLQNR